MNEASRRQRHDAFYAGASADAAAAFTSPSNYFHSLLKEVLDIYEAVASEELLHDVLKVVLDVKSCAAAFPQVH
jgi:inorganic triphosphatase YgiF